MKRIIKPVLLVLTLTLFSSCGYNTMQRNEENVFKAWGNLESQLQRRADLIPNLVATVKGSASHEKSTLESVVQARARATSTTIKPGDLSNPKAMEAFNKAQGSLSSSLSRLMVVAERYPDLKANQNFRDLQHQLEGTENRINVARVRYNEAVSTFNFSIRKFPNNITNNSMLNLEKKEYFEAAEEAKEVPKVEF